MDQRRRDRALHQRQQLRPGREPERRRSRNHPRDSHWTRWTREHRARGAGIQQHQRLCKCAVLDVHRHQEDLPAGRGRAIQYRHQHLRRLAHQRSPDVGSRMPWKRRPFGSNDLSRALNIADLREIARRRVPGFAFEYVEGGAENEVTLRANRDALERLRLIPRTLIDTAARHQRTAILGRPANAPLVIAPTGLNGMLHPQGDLALARAAARLGVPFTLSTMSTTRLEDVASRAGGRLWMQLYVLKDRAIARPANPPSAPRSTCCGTRAGCSRFSAARACRASAISRPSCRHPPPPRS